MYCPNCGNSVPNDLKYCNGCGKRLAKGGETDDSPAKMLDDILDTLFWTAILGLGILVGLVAVMLGNGMKIEVVATIVIVYLATIFGICYLLARQVPKLIDARLKVWNNASETQVPPLFARHTTAQLDEYREPVMSVTDHTTRTLDKVPVNNS